jgi:hypothetical protein
MWWLLLVGIIVIGGLSIDTLDAWRAGCSARRDLLRMRHHEAVGHRWDCRRGQWQI